MSADHHFPGGGIIKPAAVDLSLDPRAWRARKKPVAVHAQFAGRPGTLATREGPVRYEAGAALLTGTASERWPVERGTFDATYEPLAGTVPGQDGAYRKRPRDVLARRLDQPTTIAIAAGDPLRGQPGDWLLQYGPGEYGIVGNDIFSATYELLQPVGDQSDRAQGA